MKEEFRKGTIVLVTHEALKLKRAPGKIRAVYKGEEAKAGKVECPYDVKIVLPNGETHILPFKASEVGSTLDK